MTKTRLVVIIAITILLLSCILCGSLVHADRYPTLTTYHLPIISTWINELCFLAVKDDGVEFGASVSLDGYEPRWFVVQHDNIGRPRWKCIGCSCIDPQYYIYLWLPDGRQSIGLGGGFHITAFSRCGG